MASKVSGYIGKINPGNGTQYSLGSTAYGYCETAADVAAKEVDMTGFILVEGATIFIKFRYNNTVTDDLTLNVNTTGAKPLIPKTWYAGAILSLTYDGTSWIQANAYLDASVITSGKLALAKGGTNSSSYRFNSVIVGSSTQISGTENAEQLVWVQSKSGALYSTGTDQQPKFGTLPVAQGGTGNTSYTANRMIYSESAAKLSASGHYASSDKIAINSTSAPTDTFYVNGNSTFNGRVILNTTTAASNSSTPSLRVIQNTQITSNDVNHMAQFLASNMETGGANAIVLGKAVSLNQAGGLLYTQGDNTVASSLSFGFVNNLGLLKITSSGSVYINSGSSDTLNTNTSELLVKGRIVVDPSYHDTNNFSEFRINRSTIGWSAITLGGAQGTKNGAGLGVWLIGSKNSPNDATTAAANITDSQFYISYTTSTNATCRIQGHKDTGFSIRPRLTVNADVNPSYNFYVNGTSQFTGGLASGGTVYPTTDKTIDLGSATARWQNMHVGYISTYPLNGGTITQYNEILCKNNSKNLVGALIYDSGSATNVTTGRWIFQEYSPNSTANTSTTGNCEWYQLPIVTTGLTEVKKYDILTSKNTVTIAQGGTGVSSLPSGGFLSTNANGQLIGRTGAGNWNIDSPPYPGVFDANSSSTAGTLPVATTHTAACTVFEYGNMSNWIEFYMTQRIGGSTTGSASPRLFQRSCFNSTISAWVEYVQRPLNGAVPVNIGGTGLTASPSMLVNLASTTAANVLQASPRPGVTGTLPIGNGGTGATTAAAARANLGALGAVSGNYDGMANMAGATNTYIRTTQNGIIPYQAGGAGNGHSYIGTSTWRFAGIFTDTINGLSVSYIPQMQIVSYTGNNTVSTSIAFDFAPDIIICLNPTLFEIFGVSGDPVSSPTICDMSKVTTSWQPVRFGNISQAAIGMSYAKSSLDGIVVCSKSSNGKIYYVKIDTAYVNTLPSDVKAQWTAGATLGLAERAVYNYSGMVTRFLGIKFN